jgi:alpha-beta hydrolase superfamily lysophospholipase
MLRNTLWSAGLLAALGLGYALGPRYVVDVNVAPVPEFKDTEEFVASSERRFSDIVDGAEKRIVWAGTSGERTERVVVYIHGFSATRQEVAPLCDSLASRLGANLFYTRLKGHGRPADAMTAATASDWLYDVGEALAVARSLGDRVVLVGSSTGATLAIWAVSGALTEAETQSVEALVLISPNLGPADPRSNLLLLPWGEQLARIMVGEYREWTPHNEMQGRYWTTRYPMSAVFPMMGSVRAVRSADPRRFRIPVLVAYSPEDRVVDPDRIREWYDSIASLQRELLEVHDAGDPSNHILAGDILSPQTTGRLVTRAVQFLQKL